MSLLQVGVGEGVGKILIGLIFVFLVAVSGCLDKSEVRNGTSNSVFMLEKNGNLPAEVCENYELKDRVVVIESKYCGVCKIAVPRLREIEQELNMSFVYFDIAKKEELSQLVELGLAPQYTPTVLIGCEVLIGARSKEEYEQKIRVFLNESE